MQRIVSSNKTHTDYEFPTTKEKLHHDPNWWNWNHHFLAWMNGRVPVHYYRDQLINDTPNKYAMYYHLRTQKVLQNKFVLKFARYIATSGYPAVPVKDDHASFSNVKVHENAEFLYKSHQA